MTTVVIGGGITGLTAGYYINDDIIILEQNYNLGGLCSSYFISESENRYFIEEYYHHIFEQDYELLNLCAKLDIDIEWRIGTVGYSFDGKIYPLNTPFEILTYPKLTFVEKARLARFTLKCKHEDPTKVAEETAVNYIIHNAGLSVYEKFFLPLMNGKFGNEISDISAAWLISRIKLRSNRTLKGEKLGYINGGFQRLIESLSNKIITRGGEIRKNSEVKDIIIKDDATKFVQTGSEFIKADNVICTSPSLVLKYSNEKACSFQGTICSLFSLKKSVSDLYWINIGNESSFKALIEHTNLMPFENYGSNLIYVVTYVSNPVNVHMLQSSFVTDLKRFNINRCDINWQMTASSAFTAPLYNISYKYMPYRKKIKGLYFAGIFSKPNYPERSINGSIRAGMDVAELINNA